MTADTSAPPAESNDTAPEAPPRAETNPTRLRILQGRYTGPTDIDQQLRLAAALARGRSAIPAAYRNQSGDILAVMQHAMALDIQLATALDNLVFSEAGVGGMRARLMHALITRAGHEVMVTHHDDRICRMVLKRGDGRRGGGAQWTLAEASNAGLLLKKGSPWQFYGEDMLWARCLSRLARRHAPEVIAGFYVADELDDIPDEDLDSADMSAAMLDSEGNPVVAPDVENLLKDTDRAENESLEDERERLRELWRSAKQQGLMGVYAGTVDGVALTVRDYLFGRIADVEAREKAAADPAHVKPVDLTALATTLRTGGDTAAAPAAEPEPEPDSGDDAPAGAGRMSCGCESAAVLAADGTHQDGCTRPARPRRKGTDNA